MEGINHKHCRDTGQDGKLEEISSFMLQGTNRQSLPWVRKTHPRHEAAVPEVRVMGNLFPTSPEAADGPSPKTETLNASICFPGKWLASQMSLDKCSEVIRCDHPSCPASGMQIKAIIQRSNT